ncbi:hypothetical protein [Planctomicrobium sp. SH664]|uniref:hypothetical protein n=1 Tax=Planctomicrobium sp. SH664 TaxID=3448125 RepID=UPI003F5B7BFB
MRFGSMFMIALLCGCQATGGHPAACSPNDCEQFEQDCRDGCYGSESMFGFKIRHGHYVRCFDNMWTRKAARCAAYRELHRNEDECRRNTDYQQGYAQAFADVAMGGDGVVPTVPPAHYWKKCARTPEGHERAQNWFAGYAAGGPAALSYYGPYTKVASSGDPGYPPSEYLNGYGQQPLPEMTPGVDGYPQYQP